MCVWSLLILSASGTLHLTNSLELLNTQFLRQCNLSICKPLLHFTFLIDIYMNINVLSFAKKKTVILVTISLKDKQLLISPSSPLLQPCKILEPRFILFSQDLVFLVTNLTKVHVGFQGLLFQFFHGFSTGNFYLSYKFDITVSISDFKAIHRFSKCISY